MSSLAKVILSLIKKYTKAGDTANLEKISTRIDVLYAAGSLTEEEYQTLKTALPKEEEDTPKE